MIKLTTEVNLQDFILLLPAVAVGNVAQLTIDLLITSQKMKKIGHVANCCFIPILGADPYIKDSSNLCTSADFYVQESKKLVALQIRSPAVKNLQGFFQDLGKFVADHGISKVVILTSAWAHTRSDIQIRTEPMRFLASPNCGEIFSSLDFLELGIPSIVILRFCSEGDNVPDAVAVLEYLNRWLAFGFDAKKVKFPDSWEFLFGNPAPVDIY